LIIHTSALVYAKPDVVMAVTMRTAVFWDVTLCSLVDGPGTNASILKMEATGCSETLVIFIVTAVRTPNLI
jgi:hypothetical protein